MLNRKQKEKVVNGLSEKFSKEKIAIFSSVRGVPVLKLNALRREFKKLNGELKVAKKTLLRRALDIAGITLDPKTLEGELGIIFGYENEVETARIAQKFQKEKSGDFKILAGLLGKKLISASEVTALANLPPKEQLLARLAGTIAAPLRNLLYVLQGNQRNLVVILNKIQNSKSK